MSCDKCGCNDLQDEKHVLFYCNCEKMCELCTKFADLFEGLFLPLQTFSRSSSMIPFLSTFQHVSNRDVTDFLGQKNFRLYKCVAEMVQIVDKVFPFLFFISLPSSQSSRAEGLFPYVTLCRQIRH